MISLIFQVDQGFVPLAPRFLPLLISFINNSSSTSLSSSQSKDLSTNNAANGVGSVPGDWTTKKVAIDAIYSMAAIIKEEIVPFKNEILRSLNHCRFDKIKPVREATLETIKLLKEIGPPQQDPLTTNNVTSNTSNSEDDQVIIGTHF